MLNSIKDSLNIKSTTQKNRKYLDIFQDYFKIFLKMKKTKTMRDKRKSPLLLPWYLACFILVLLFLDFDFLLLWQWQWFWFLFRWVWRLWFLFWFLFWLLLWLLFWYYRFDDILLGCFLFDVEILYLVLGRRPSTNLLQRNLNLARKNRTKNKRKIPRQIHCLLPAEFGKEK